MGQTWSYSTSWYGHLGQLEWVGWRAMLYYSMTLMLSNSGGFLYPVLTSYASYVDEDLRSKLRWIIYSSCVTISPSCTSVLHMPGAAPSIPSHTLHWTRLDLLAWRLKCGIYWIMKLWIVLVHISAATPMDAHFRTTRFWWIFKNQSHWWTWDHIWAGLEREVSSSFAQK